MSSSGKGWLKRTTKQEKNRIKEELQLEFILSVGIEKLRVAKKKGERVDDLGRKQFLWCVCVCGWWVRRRVVIG